MSILGSLFYRILRLGRRSPSRNPSIGPLMSSSGLVELNTREFIGHTHNDRLVPYSVKVKRKSLTQRSFPALSWAASLLPNTWRGSMILQVLSVSPPDPYSFQFIQTEPTHGLTGVYTIVNSFMSPVSLSISNYTISRRICQEKTFS